MTNGCDMGAVMDREHYAAYVREEANHEIVRLKALLRNSEVSEEEREIAEAMLEFYQEAKTCDELTARHTLEVESVVLGRTRRNSRSSTSDCEEEHPHKKRRAA